MIIFISDFDLRGSGYMNIAVATCNELVRRGYAVTALGAGYDGTEHHWDFSIIPVPHRAMYGQIPMMVHNLKVLADAGKFPPIEAIIVALDIPAHDHYLKMQAKVGIPYIGIFPVESRPLCQTWANVLAKMDERLVISKFGLHEMEEVGVNGVHFPVGLDTDSWRMPSPEERTALRASMNYADDEFVILTVADNQERKNLSSAMDVVKILAERGVNVHWNLVTRIGSTVGWKLHDMAVAKGVADRCSFFERGLAHERLWMLHASSDAFLLTSKAEGLCMPVVEAMASGVPVVATDVSAIPEHLWADYPARGIQRGLPIDVEYWVEDPWGNSMRAYINRESAANQLMRIKENEFGDKLVKSARAYAEGRTWEAAGEVLDEVLQRLIVKPAVAPPAEAPPTLPHVVPPIVAPTAPPVVPEEG